jgi:probable phosphoglycerate mutase
MGVTELILVRHGESEGNVAAAQADAAGAEVIQIGLRDADVPLSGLGFEQATALGTGLQHLGPKHTPTAVWCSPYLRAQQTAQTSLNVAGLQLPFVTDERLRDRELGVLDLLTTGGVFARFPYEADRRRWVGKFYHRPAGGESWADVIHRVRTVLHDMDLEEPEGRVLVVCHDALVLAFRYVCERMSEQQVLAVGTSTPVRNVSITRLVRQPHGRRWQLVTFNDVRHLVVEETPVTEHAGDRSDETV